VAPQPSLPHTDKPSNWENGTIYAHDQASAEARATLSLISTSLDADKAEDLVVIDLAGKTSIADYMVIASGGSRRHIGAMADRLLEKLKASGHRDISVEGTDQSDWVLIDAGDVVVHLFRPEVRSFYALERLWAAPSAGFGGRSTLLASAVHA
jgi:ribosome-associated protein